MTSEPSSERIADQSVKLATRVWLGRLSSADSTRLSWWNAREATSPTATVATTNAAAITARLPARWDTLVA